MAVDGFEHRAGTHCGSVAMRDVLAWAGIDLSEPMVFGLGSGLGFFYLKSDHVSPSRQIMGWSAALETNAAEALGLELTEHRTGDPEEGWLGVREALVQGRPVIVQCDSSELPYWETETPFNGHRIVVAGFDEETDTVEVADTHFEGLQTIDRATLHRARASEAPPSMDDDFAWWELAPDEPAPLREAIPRALQTNVDQITDHGAEVGGLSGLDVFRDEVTDWRGREDGVWSYRFAHECIANRGTDGAMFRNLYRSYLTEAAEELPDITRQQLPVSMSRNADAWSTLATYLNAMALYLETGGDEPGEDPSHHVESMAEAVYQFESTFWQRLGDVVG